MSGTTTELGFGVSGPPRYTATITSGTGNYTPQVGTTWLRVALLGGGAAGNSTGAVTYCSAGYAAKPIVHWLKWTGGSYAYAVAAGGAGVAGAPGNSGGDTTFGALTAYGATQGVLNGTAAGPGPCGESSGFGKGGVYPSGNASGYGAGGGGTNGGGATGGNGSGGLILVEEY